MTRNSHVVGGEDNFASIILPDEENPLHMDEANSDYFDKSFVGSDSDEMNPRVQNKATEQSMNPAYQIEVDPAEITPEVK